MKTIIEPFRIKSVEPLRHTTPEERERYLAGAGYNLFLIEARNILIDLLTDSGTSAMSTEQWAAVMRGDESYAGSESFFRMKRAVDELTGFPHMIPTHQGRAAERILFTVLCRPGHVVPNNTHFDTTRANIEFTGARAVDLPVPEAADTQARLDFKGNMDVPALERLIEIEGADKIPLVMLTVTNNSGGGQPVSMANIEAVKSVAARHGIPLYLDACRFAENAWFIRERERAYANCTPKQIALLLFNREGDCLAAKLRPGNVHSADDWEELLLPEIERQQKLGKDVVFRADAAFAKPEIYEALEERGVKYAIRIPSNDSLERDIAELLTRPVGRPSQKPVVWYKGFLYQAASWKTARRVVAKVEFHFAELFPRVGFIVTNLETDSRAVVRLYNKRGTAEQWIKEGKQAVKMTRLSCHRFRSNEVRLWLSVMPYNLGNLWRRLVLPKRIDNWSLTSLQQRLVKTGGRLVKHARYYWLLLAESHLTQRLFRAMVGRIAALPVGTG
jgi:hypothetical protein